MGLLDDAIKQHLELKRRRGADPGEIERLEREALGPVRRLPEEQAAEAADPAGAADLPYDEPRYDEEPYEEDLVGPEDEYEELDEGYEPPQRSATSEEAFGEDEEADRPGSHGADPPQGDPLLDEHRAPDDHLAGPDDDPGVETAEYDVEAEHAHGRGHPEREEGDPLEETPEFFQDAPDHDRLWFEQRPPKDFDFEG